MNLKLDHVKDPGSMNRYLAAEGLSPMPARAKEKTASVHRDDHALSVQYLDGRWDHFFPVDTRENTALSALFFRQKTAEETLPVPLIKVAAAGIYTAMRRHNMPIPESDLPFAALVQEEVGDQGGVYIYDPSDPVLKGRLQAEQREKVKQASTSKPTWSRYALPSKRKYPLDTVEQVVAAEEWLEKNASALRIGDRYTFGRHLVARMAEMEMPDPRPSTIALSAIEPNVGLYADIEGRRALLFGELKEKLAEVQIHTASAVLSRISHALEDGESGDELVEALNAFDERMEMKAHWDKPASGIRNPIDAVYQPLPGGTPSWLMGARGPADDARQEPEFLKRIRSQEGMEKIANTVRPEIAAGLRVNPIQTWNALPERTRKVLYGVLTQGG